MFDTYNIEEELRRVANLSLPSDDADFTPTVARKCLSLMQGRMLEGALEIERLETLLAKAQA